MILIIHKERRKKKEKFPVEVIGQQYSV